MVDDYDFVFGCLVGWVWVVFLNNVSGMEVKYIYYFVKWVMVMFIVCKLLFGFVFFLFVFDGLVIFMIVEDYEFGICEIIMWVEIIGFLDLLGWVEGNVVSGVIVEMEYDIFCWCVCGIWKFLVVM